MNTLNFSRFYPLDISEHYEFCSLHELTDLLLCSFLASWSVSCVQLPHYIHPSKSILGAQIKPAASKRTL